MMIKKYKDIIDIIQNPVKGEQITDKIKVVNEIPILIDFENSICDESSFLVEEGVSKVSRPKYFESFLLYKLKRLVSPIPNITKKNIDWLKKSLTTRIDRPKLLIVGGGTIGRGTDVLYKCDEIDIISFDVYYSENISFIADAHNIPLKDSSVDAVLIQYVLEHVVQPEKVVAEINRVLKPDGLVYSETPFLEQVHEAAYDYTRFTHSGHRYLFKDFDEINSGIVCGAGTHLMWTIEYLFRGIFRSKKIGKVFKLLFFWVQYLDLLIPQNYAIDMADSFFFMGKKAQSPLSVKALPIYYKGADNR